ncbi:NAD-dependent epimerase/dehydratase family protein [Candidatus Lucifugimonas marina]|uniref:NAD-dependent epimerase/dehydratase family protein n=1 Tax=Candidatus Lucifugimonas marina TaxID=3038979 RepID=A0AAJ6CQE6_9CHLR|nr:NAD-dependent epimerase/dehydratase family protein [SAR202 cluster bacterium JH702]MDG0869594.1 NAD-dependent epimerase/dehydratase family protein [SAR202 cluster bacterium JH639]WFG34327.1 NAD-dependent epimerase/dehydratase family protein [SAR202 cluster bacterium JH545]WFG38256.1 NAD-dependent epimerase/dehydratase family protein [SAR202 cluster bacterium JH1073]
MEKSSKILVTGMSGLIGGLAGRKFAETNEVTALGRSQVEGFPTTVVDIGDGIDEILPALEGVETVIHMAGSRGDVPAETHIKANVTGVYNLFEACRIAGVKRIVAASTGAVIAGYEKDDPYKSLVDDPDFEMPSPRPMITVEDPIRPRNMYSVSKMFTENLGRMYSEQYDISIICIRIGKVEINDVPLNARNASVWCSHRDILQMIAKAVNAPSDLKYALVFACSDNPTRYRDIAHAKEVLGFVPQDSAADHGF